MESVAREFTYEEAASYKNTFHWTMTYRADSDIPNR